MFFLPKNTSVEEIIERLLPHHAHFLGDQSSTPVSMRKRNELVLEIEQLMFGTSCKALLVSTGSLCKVHPQEVAAAFIQQCCNTYGTQSHSSQQAISAKSSEKSEQDNSYLQQLLTNVFAITGFQNSLKFLSKKGGSKTSLQKVIKQIQAKYSQEEWTQIKKFHKRMNSSCRKGSNIVSEGQVQKSKGKYSTSMASSCSMSQTSKHSVEESKTNIKQSNRFQAQLKRALGVAQGDAVCSKSAATKSIKTWSRTSRTSSFSQCSSGGGRDDNSDQQASRPRKLHHISSNHQQMRFRKMQKNRIPDQYMIDEEMHSSYGEEEAEEIYE